MARILVTGAGGFIGRALCPVLAAAGHYVIAGLRAPGPVPAGAEPRVLGNIAAGRRWEGALGGAEIVIHLAQRAHRRGGAFAGEPEAATALGHAAAQGGARRFVYVSSIRAMGETTAPGRPFQADHPCRPGDPYGKAKLTSEQALAAVAAESGLELVILRPPLVYGPGVGGNFRALMRLAASGLPLPFGGINNRRSLIALDNLVPLLGVLAAHPAAAGQVLLAADVEALSTPVLIGILAMAQGQPARLYGVPQALLAAARQVPAAGPLLARLTLSLEVDDRATRRLLSWTPPVAAEAALRATAMAFTRDTGAR